MFKQWLKWGKVEKPFSLEDFTNKEVDEMFVFFNSSSYKKLREYILLKDFENLKAVISKDDFTRGKVIGEIDGRKRFLSYLKSVVDFYKKNS